MLNRGMMALVALALAAGWAGPAFGQDDKSELDKLLKDDATELKADVEAVEPGDKKEFTVVTDDNISALEVGDVYKNNGCLFKVISIRSKGTGGGKFVVQRTAGKVDPALRWQRASGVGPMSIGGVQTLADLYLAGGPFLHPIAVLALVMVLLAFNSLWIYRTRRQVPPAFVREAGDLLDAGDLERFERLASQERGLFPHICRALVERFDTSEAEDIRARVEAAAGTQITRLRIWVRALNLIAAAAPLLGLLGTIVGMIIVFEAISTATGAAKAQALASGIRVKLFSTTAALMVAIPSLFLFFIFNQKLGSIVGRCEVLTEQFLHKVLVMKRQARGTRAAADPADESEAPADQPPAKPRKGAREVRP